MAKMVLGDQLSETDKNAYSNTSAKRPYALLRHMAYDSSVPVDYLRAMRTKPFLLIAGISGTGKSRVVKTDGFRELPRKVIDRAMTIEMNWRR